MSASVSAMNSLVVIDLPGTTGAWRSPCGCPPDPRWRRSGRRRIRAGSGRRSAAGRTPRNRGAPRSRTTSFKSPARAALSRSGSTGSSRTECVLHDRFEDFDGERTQTDPVRWRQTEHVGASLDRSQARERHSLAGLDMQPAQRDRTPDLLSAPLEASGRSWMMTGVRGRPIQSAARSASVVGVVRSSPRAPQRCSSWSTWSAAPHLGAALVAVSPQPCSRPARCPPREAGAGRRRPGRRGDRRRRPLGRGNAADYFLPSLLANIASALITRRRRSSRAGRYWA